METGGFGFKIFVSEKSLRSFPKIGSSLRLFCVFSVRQDGGEIYGFLDEKEKDIFQLLTSVSGVGPKSALKILGKIKFETLLSAVASGKADLIAQKWGIGQKKAERIILELRNKARQLQQNDDGGAALEADQEIFDILVNLGYKQKEIKKAVSNLPDKIVKTEERLKKALKILSS